MQMQTMLGCRFQCQCFEKLSGFPNNFWGWGGEDDELRNRMREMKMGYRPKTGSLVDLENMTLQEKLEVLRSQNTDAEGSNHWRCMVKTGVRAARRLGDLMG